jgi:hypothetical protein
MNFLRAFFKPQYSLDIYQGAGCLFTDGKQILAGYQPKGPYISGLGGSRENGENYHQTAIRETVEELFDVNPSEELIYQLQSIPYSRRLMNGPYVVLVYSFADLNTFIQICSIHIKESRLYEKFPASFLDLIINRKLIDTSEVQQLYILPFNTELHIDKNFLKDLSQL